MNTNKIIAQIKTILHQDRIEMAPTVPDVQTGLVAIKKGVIKYSLLNDELVGLNLAGAGMTNQQWNEILKIEGLDMAKIQALNLSNNGLENFELPATFTGLKYLEISGNKKLKKFSFAVGLSSLERLILRDNCLLKLVLPNGCSGLKYLDASRNKISRISFGGVLPELYCLEFTENAIKNVDMDWLALLPALKYWYLYKNPLNQSLRVFHDNDLSGNNYLNAFKALKQAFDNKESIKNEEYKILIVGDGAAGKTCLSNRLIQNAFIEDDSSHGIIIRKFVDDKKLYNCPYTLNIWDFGGQDIYHATHRLFLQSSAVYLLVWNKKTEEEAFSSVKVGRKWREYKNRKLEYWMEYIYAYGKGSPVLVVQTCKEKFPDHECENKAAFIERYDAKLSTLEFVKVDSKPDDKRKNGFKKLMDGLDSAIYELGREEYLPSHWVALKKCLEDRTPASEYKSTSQFLDAEDATISYENYEVVAREHDVENPELLLTKWLVPIGTVFYKKGYFDNKIILNQEWAIRAIYILFERNEDLGYYREICENDGRFTGAQLTKYWEGYGRKEQALFVDFMLSCSMCYEVKGSRNDDKVTFEERKFIAPEMMKEKRPNGFEMQEKRWSYDKEQLLRLRYVYNFPHYSYFQQFLVKTQADAEEMTDVYRNGMHIYDSGANAIIAFNEEQRCINVTVSKNGIKLLNRIQNRFKEIHPDDDFITKIGVGEHWITQLKMGKWKEQNVQSGERIETEAGLRVPASIFAPFFNFDEKEKFKATTPDPKPAFAAAKIYFSYAWGDLKKKDISGENIVDQLYNSLSKDFNIYRDKMNLEYGGLISEFMKELGQGDLIVVFISDKYALSPYCMFELCKIAEESKWKKETFTGKVLLVPVEFVDFTDRDVLEKYFDHWEKEQTGWANLITKRSQQTSVGQMTRFQNTKAINQDFGKLADWIADINATTIKLLSENDFALIRETIIKRLGRNDC